MRDAVVMVNIRSLAVEDNDEGVYVSAQIDMPAAEGEAWVQLPAGTKTDIEGVADAFFVIGLILAIGSDGVLAMDQPVSPRLIYNSQAAQDILSTWYPKQLVPARLEDRKSTRLNSSHVSNSYAVFCLK